MKKIKTFIGAIMAAMFMIQPVAAQQVTSKSDRTAYPYAFIGIQGGMQTTFTNYPAHKLITPIGAFSVGGMFTPAIGARINVSGMKSKGGLKLLNETYDYKFVNSNFDVMLNLCNLFDPHRNHTLNAYLIGGAGLGYAWDNSAISAEAMQHLDKNINARWNSDRFVHSFRVGMQLEAELGRHIGLNLEVTANNLQDKFNAKLNGKGDWQLQAMLGLNFKFGGRSKKAVAEDPVPVPVVPEYKEEPTPAPQPEPEQKPEPQPEKKLESKRVEVFFVINRHQPSAEQEAKLADLAEWLKQHPTAQVELVGYADAGTGNASINERIAKRRVNEVARLLTEKYGISTDRIATDSKGDTIQPFANNNDNRVVIGIGTEK